MAGVEHVMRLFFDHFTDQTTAAAVPEVEANDDDAHAAEMDRIMEVFCDEAAIDNA